MRTGRLIVLAAVVLALGAYILLYERHQPTTEEAQQRAKKVLAGLERDQIASLEITNRHGSFTLEKKDDHWRLVKPMASPADETAVSSAVTSLVGLKIDRELKAGEVKPEEYGLDKPTITVAVATKDGTRRVFKVGKKAPLGADRAVSIGDGRILLCSGFFTSDLEKDLDGWRSHRVVEVFPDQVASIDVTAGNDHIQAVKDGKLWRLLAPLKDLADADHIRNLISGLNSLKVVQFVDEKTPDLKAMGLNNPRYHVVLVRTEGAKPVQLDFGAKKTVDGKVRVACRRGGTDVFWVDDRAENALGLAPVLWRSRKVYPFESWNVNAATFVREGKTVQVARKEGVWKLADGTPADGGEVLSRLGKLAELRAVNFDLVASGPKQMGSVTLKIADDTARKSSPRKVTFTFFAPLQPGGNALVKVNGRATVMSVEVAKVNAILGGLDKLRQRPKPTPVPKKKA